MNHPSRETLTLLAYGFLDSSEEAAARAHLAECPSCRADWAASRGEASAVKSAFEPAVASRRTSWWPALAGMAASVLIGLALSGSEHASFKQKRDSAAERVANTAPTPPGLSVTGEWAGAQIRRKGSGDVGLDDGRIMLSYWGGGTGVVFTPEANVTLCAGTSLIADVQLGETRIVVHAGSCILCANGAQSELKAWDAAAVPHGRPPVILRAEEDPAPRLAALNDRFAALERRIASLPARTDFSSETPEGVGRWLAHAVIAGRRLEEDVAMSEELGRLWSRAMRRDGVSAREIEAGSARERLLAGYFEVRCPLSDEKTRAWWQLINQHESAWREFLRERKSLTGLERALAAARVAAKRGPEYDSLLESAQAAAVAELGATFRDWRRGFAPVFDIVVGIGGPEKALEAAAGPGGMPAGAAPIMREHLDACLALHRDFGGSGDPAGEQVRVIELLIKTRDRLVNELGYSRESASARVVNFVEGASK